MGMLLHRVTIDNPENISLDDIKFLAGRDRLVLSSIGQGTDLFLASEEIELFEELGFVVNNVPKFTKLDIAAMINNQKDKHE